MFPDDIRQHRWLPDHIDQPGGDKIPQCVLDNLVKDAVHSSAKDSWQIGGISDGLWGIKNTGAVEGCNY